MECDSERRWRRKIQKPGQRKRKEKRATAVQEGVRPCKEDPKDVKNNLTQLSDQAADMICCTFCIDCVLLLTYSVFYRKCFCIVSGVVVKTAPTKTLSK